MPKKAKPGAAYYEGGERVVLGGVPCKLFIKPGPNGLGEMRKTARGFCGSNKRVNYKHQLVSMVDGLTEKEAYNKAMEEMREARWQRAGVAA